MAPLPAAGQAIRVKLPYSIGADTTAECLLHFSYTGSAPSTANCVTLAGSVRASWSTHLAPWFTSAGGLGHVEVLDLSSTSGASGVDTTNVSGSRAGGALPNGVAVLINGHIARRYRGGKPRSYQPLMTAADVISSGSWNSTSVSALQSDWNAFIAGIVGAVAGSTTISASVNISYYSGFTNVPYGSPTKYRRTPNVRGTPLVENITSWTVNSKPASQRRRNLH